MQVAAATGNHRHGSAAQQHDAVACGNVIVGDVQRRCVYGSDMRASGKQRIVSGLQDVEATLHGAHRSCGLFDVRIEPYRLAVALRHDPYAAIVAVHLMPDYGLHHQHAGYEGQQHNEDEHWGNAPAYVRRHGERRWYIGVAYAAP